MNKETQGKIKLMFDYHIVNDDHKAAVSEVCRLLEGMGQAHLTDHIKRKFKVIEPPKYDLNESEFIKACNDAGITYSVQGHLFGNEVDYQMVGIVEDIRKLNDFIKKIKES
jgi:methyl coenzyme M reductase subunit D